MRDQLPSTGEPSFCPFWALGLLALFLILLGATNVTAQTYGAETPGEFRTASQLTGDWWGVRPRLESEGVTFLGSNTSFLIGNATGGASQALDYSGHGDYLLKFDGSKLGIADDTYLKLRAEHRYGPTVVSNVGCFISPTLITDLPVFNSDQLYLTNVLIDRKVSDSLEVFAGKMDTLDGDKNAFAHQRGKTQFSNMAFVFNPIVGATVPYSTLGAGFVLLAEDEQVFTFTVLNSTDTTNTSGFRELFNDGVLLSAALRVPVSIFGKSGHQFLGATWNSQTYTSLREAYIQYPTAVIPTTRGSWALFWNFDQYLVNWDDDSGRGWGAFGRAGIADKDTSPIAWFLSFGVGGDSPLQSRPDDTFGIGWYHAAASSFIGPILAAQYGPIGSGEGVECYYNYQLTPAIRITPDLQVVVPSLRDFPTALILGVRGQLFF